MAFEKNRSIWVVLYLVQDCIQNSAAGAIPCSVVKAKNI